MSTSGSQWFEDDAVLTAEIKRTRSVSAAAPAIPGYDQLREVARGGQGVVFRGVQRSTKRAVAIKVLSEGALAAPSARRRFEREVDVVAGLRHPNIVAVYDSGVTPDARPYLVMEFIEGRPLDEAVRDGERALPIPETVDLLAKVCEAVQFAHQRGVIHRDLKPSNIRVDRAGVPHVLDFGLAKAAGAEQGAQSVLSMSGQFMGSLPWASPEQASGDPEAVDTRSDVYALGVILYQLLTGRFPYDVTSGLRSTLDHIVGTIPEPAAKFRAGVDDEIATILARCLAKEPERRYQSAGDLARDLRHYLAGEPIEAKRDSAWYTVRTTVRRYRVALAVGVAFVLVLVAGLVVSIRAEREASRQRDAAKAQVAKADAINAFLMDMLGAADPDKDGPKTPVVDLLDRAASQVEEKFKGQDEVQIAVLGTLRGNYSRLGEFAKAEVLADKLVALSREVKGAQHPDTLACEADRALMVYKQQRHEEAETELRRILELQRKIVGPFSTNTMMTVSTIGQVLSSRQKSAEAAALYEGVMEGALKNLGPDDDAVIALTGNLGFAYHDLGRFGEAEKLYREAWERRKKRDGPESSEAMSLMNNLGTVLMQLGRNEEAEPLIKTQYESAARRLGPDHASTLASAHNYAKLLQDLGRLDDAEPMMLDTWQRRVRLLGEDHPHTLISLSNLGPMYMLRKKPEESLKFNTRAYELRLAKLGPDHIDTVISMNNMAGTMRDMGRVEEALPYYERAVEITDRTHPPGHFFNALFRMNRGFCRFKLGMLIEAETDYLEAEAALVKAVGPAHGQTKRCRQNLVDLYEKWGRPEDAARFRPEPAPPPP